MFKKLTILLFVFFLANPEIFAQNELKKIKPVKKDSIRDHLPKTVVFKIKPDLRHTFSQQKEKLPVFNKITKETGVVSIEKMFPQHNEPEKKHDDLGRPMVDLSLIYVLTYTNDISVQEAVEIIKKTGVVEYAEPSYVDHLLMIPNDPFAGPDTSLGFYFTPMQAYEAFDVEDGDTNVVIGIIDTGAEWYHEDLVDNIKYNYADPINTLDDDGDGFVDNFRGWDFGDNDNDPDALGNLHGTVVAGCASATPNNNKGLTGTGGKCKFLPVKGAPDASASFGLPAYNAIVYAADHGCKVINLSWGGPGGYSAANQDKINYAAINKDVVIVAAAGNTYGATIPFYPATYDNVLSVAGLDTMYNAALDSFIEVRAWYATNNHYVDVAAMGRWITSTYANTVDYSHAEQGSSFASPLVAGAAGLVRSKYPSLKAGQVAELLRVTCDPLIDTVAANLGYKEEKSGKGRINMYRALTELTSPAIRMYENHIFNNFGNYAYAGDTIKISCKFRNFLAPSNNAIVTISTSSPNITVVKGDFTIGSLATLDSINNISDEFILYIHPDAALNENVFFRLGYQDLALGYNDYQYFEALINPGFLDIDTNKITLTMSRNGRMGYIDEASSIGNGMIYKNQSILYEGGLMIGINDTTVSDCVRNGAGTSDFDFSFVESLKYVHSVEGDMETRTAIVDTLSPNPIGLKIVQRTYATKNAPDDKYIIIEYDITNLSGDTIDTLNAGIYADWDIQNAFQNRSNWSAADSIGYTYALGVNGIHAGVCLLTNNPPSCFSMDHFFSGGNNIDPNDGFPSSEKYATLANGIARPLAGTGDVSQTVGGELYNLLINETRTIAFAIVAGDNLTDLSASARRAKNKFRSLNTSSIPTTSSLHFCDGDTVTATITPGNGTKFNFHNSPGSVSPVYSGNSYTMNNIFKGDTIYVRGADSLFESTPVPTYINFHSEILADFAFAPDTLDLDISKNAFFVDKSDNALTVSWDLGDGNTSTTPNFLHQYQNPGIYTIKLTATGAYGCQDTISKNLVVIGTPAGIPDTNFPFVEDGIKFYPNPASDNINIEFILQNPQNISINIYNSLGEKIHETEAEQVMLQNFNIPLSGKPSGVYYARIKIGDKLITRKFVIK